MTRPRGVTPSREVSEGTLALLPTLERVVVRVLSAPGRTDSQRVEKLAHHLDLKTEEVQALARRGLALAEELTLVSDPVD